MLRTWLAVAGCLALASPAGAEDAPPAAQKHSFRIEVKLVQGSRLSADIPREAIAAELIPTPSTAEPPVAKSAEPRDWWNESGDGDRLKVVIAPTILAPENLSALVQVHNKKPFTYLVREAKAGKQVKYYPMTVEAELGLEFECAVKSIDGVDDSVELSPIKISQRSFEGREAEEGLGLATGKPIFAERSLETAFRVKLGEPKAITISPDRDRQVFLLLRVRRAEQ